MKDKTKIKVLGKCYVKARKNNSDDLNSLAIDIANRLTKLEKEDPDAAQDVRVALREEGYYE